MEKYSKHIFPPSCSLWMTGNPLFEEFSRKQKSEADWRFPFRQSIFFVLYFSKLPGNKFARNLFWAQNQSCSQGWLTPFANQLFGPQLYQRREEEELLRRRASKHTSKRECSTSNPRHRERWNLRETGVQILQWKEDGKSKREREREQKGKRMRWLKILGEGGEKRRVGEFDSRKGGAQPGTGERKCALPQLQGASGK